MASIYHLISFDIIHIYFIYDFIYWNCMVEITRQEAVHWIQLNPVASNGQPHISKADGRLLKSFLPWLMSIDESHCYQTLWVPMAVRNFHQMSSWKLSANTIHQTFHWSACFTMSWAQVFHPDGHDNRRLGGTRPLERPFWERLLIDVGSLLLNVEFMSKSFDLRASSVR